MYIYTYSMLGTLAKLAKRMPFRILNPLLIKRIALSQSHGDTDTEVLACVAHPSLSNNKDDAYTSIHICETPTQTQ